MLLKYLASLTVCCALLRAADHLLHGGVGVGHGQREEAEGLHAAELQGCGAGEGECGGGSKDGKKGRTLWNPYRCWSGTGGMRLCEVARKNPQYH